MRRMPHAATDLREHSHTHAHVHTRARVYKHKLVSFYLERTVLPRNPVVSHGGRIVDAMSTSACAFKLIELRCDVCRTRRPSRAFVHAFVRTHARARIQTQTRFIISRRRLTHATSRNTPRRQVALITHTRTSTQTQAFLQT